MFGHVCAWTCVCVCAHVCMCAFVCARVHMHMETGSQQKVSFLACCPPFIFGDKVCHRTLSSLIQLNWLGLQAHSATPASRDLNPRSQACLAGTLPAELSPRSLSGVLLIFRSNNAVGILAGFRSPSLFPPRHPLDARSTPLIHPQIWQNICWKVRSLPLRI